MFSDLWRLRCYLAEFNLAFLFFSVKSGLQHVVTSLYFHLWWDILIALIVATSSKVFLIWLNVVSRFLPLNHGNNSATLHFICLLWSFRSFGVVDSTSTLIIFKMVPICWFGQSWPFCFLSDLVCFLASLWGSYLKWQWEAIKLKLTVWINFIYYTCFFYHEIASYQASPETVCPFSNYFSASKMRVWL